MEKQCASLSQERTCDADLSSHGIPLPYGIPPPVHGDQLAMLEDGQPQNHDLGQSAVSAFLVCRKTPNKLKRSGERQGPEGPHDITSTPRSSHTGSSPLDFQQSRRECFYLRSLHWVPEICNQFNMSSFRERTSFSVQGRIETDRRRNVRFLPKTNKASETGRFQTFGKVQKNHLSSLGSGMKGYVPRPEPKTDEELYNPNSLLYRLLKTEVAYKSCFKSSRSWAWQHRPVIPATQEG